MRFHKEEELVEDVILLIPTPTSAHDQQEEVEAYHPSLMSQDDQEPEEEEEEEEEEDGDDQEVNGVEEEDGDDDQEGNENENVNHDEEEDEDNEEEVDSDEEEEEEDGDYKEEGDNKEEEEEEVCSTDVPTTAPLYLVYHHGRRKCKQSFFSISEGIHFVRSVPEMNGMTCWACCEGWLVMVDNYSRRCFLFNPVTMEKIELPPMKTSCGFVCCVLSSSPPDCVVMFVYDFAKCLFCRPNDQRWTRKILGPKWKEGLTNRHCFKVIDGAVSCKGKIYLTFKYGGGIKVLDTATEYNAPRINNHSLRVVEKIKFEENLPMDVLDFFCSTARTSTYLVESCGEIFMVIKIYRVFNEDFRNLNVYTFNVFRLNSSLSSTPTGTAATYCWEKVESLGDDRVFFLHQTCSLSTSASKLQVKENYIYYCEPDDEYLYAFNMKNSRFSRILPCPHLVRHRRKQPCWMLLPII